MKKLDAGDIPEYRNHLVKAFSYIRSNPTVLRGCPHIAQLSGNISNILRDFNNPQKWKLDVDPAWVIPIESDGRNFEENEALLVLSGIMTVNNSKFEMYTFVSSIVLVSENADDANNQIPFEDYCEHKHIYRDRLTRRFHFDLAARQNGDTKPRSHFQFGGKEQKSHYIYSLNPRISIPRIPYPPIDFIILFDMMLRQFRTRIRSRFYDSKEWINLVKKSESYRLKSYYDLIQNYFTHSHRKPLSDKFSDEKFFC